MRSQRRLCFLDAISRFLLFGDDADQVCWAKKSKQLRKSDSDQRVTPRSDPHLDYSLLQNSSSRACLF